MDRRYGEMIAGAERKLHVSLDPEWRTRRDVRGFGKSLGLPTGRVGQLDELSHAPPWRSQPGCAGSDSWL